MHNLAVQTQLNNVGVQSTQQRSGCYCCTSVYQTSSAMANKATYDGANATTGYFEAVHFDDKVTDLEVQCQHGRHDGQHVLSW